MKNLFQHNPALKEYFICAGISLIKLTGLFISSMISLMVLQIKIGLFFVMNGRAVFSDIVASAWDISWMISWAIVGVIAICFVGSRLLGPRHIPLSDRR